MIITNNKDEARKQFKNHALNIYVRVRDGEAKEIEYTEATKLMRITWNDGKVWTVVGATSSLLDLLSKYINIKIA